MELLVRPACASDRQAVGRIALGLWHGNDYIPAFFDRWVREGGFWVGERRGRVVGCGKATRLAPGEWWLEGLRVDPKAQKRGIGTELSRRILYRALDERPTSLRLATGAANRESIRIIEQHMGFRRCAEYRQMGGPPVKPTHPARVHLVRPSVDEALGFLAASDELNWSHGLVQQNWQFRELSRRYVAELRTRGCLYGVRRQGRLRGLLVLIPHRYHSGDLDIPFVGGDVRARAAFGTFIRAEAARLSTSRISAMAASREMSYMLRDMGAMDQPRRNLVYVFEYPI
jgi:GNAT superfamily N-acetyltransferase